MFKGFDWKYLLMLVVTVALSSPWWITYITSANHSLTVQVVSQASIQPPTGDLARALVISVDNAPVKEPFFSVLKIANEGDKAIATKDFETPLEIGVSAPISVVRANISTKMPNDIPAQIDWDKSTVRLKPTLLNPNDSITISVLTDGGNPKFTPHARIIGVASVPLTYPTNSGMSTLQKVGMLVGGFLISIPMLIAYRRWDPFTKDGTVIYRGTLTSLIFVSQAASLVLMVIPVMSWGVDGVWKVMGIAVSLLLVAAIIAKKLDTSKQVALEQDRVAK